MSEFRTFGLDEARVLFTKRVNIELDAAESGGWWASGYPTHKCPYRLTPEQELTFEQACLLVGLGLDEELEKRDSVGDDPWGPAGKSLCAYDNYRTRPLPKQTKIIPHTMETAPVESSVKGLPDTMVGERIFDAHVRSDGCVMLLRDNVMLYTLTFEQAQLQLAVYPTGKPYGMEVEA